MKRRHINTQDTYLFIINGYDYLMKELFYNKSKMLFFCFLFADMSDGGPQKFPCFLCDYQSRNKDDLKTHFTKKHSTELLQLVSQPETEKARLTEKNNVDSEPKDPVETATADIVLETDETTAADVLPEPETTAVEPDVRAIEEVVVKLNDVSFCENVLDSSCSLSPNVSADFGNVKHFTLNVSVFKCPICRTDFETKEKFYHHWNERSLLSLDSIFYQLEFECHLCQEVFHDFQELCCHEKDKTLSQNDIRVRLKERDYRQKSKVSIPADTCFNCSICLKTECSLSVLRSHYTFEHHESEFDVTKIHVQVPIDPDFKKYRCKNCPAAFDSGLKLKLHFKRKHPGEPFDQSENEIFTCPNCPEFWTDKEYRLKLHRKTKQHLINSENIIHNAIDDNNFEEIIEDAHFETNVQVDSLDEVSMEDAVEENDKQEDIGEHFSDQSTEKIPSPNSSVEIYDQTTEEQNLINCKLSLISKVKSLITLESSTEDDEIDSNEIIINWQSSQIETSGVDDAKAKITIENDQGVLNKAISETPKRRIVEKEKMFTCSPCKFWSDKRIKLKKHLKTKGHLKQAANFQSDPGIEYNSEEPSEPSYDNEEQNLTSSNDQDQNEAETIVQTSNHSADQNTDQNPENCADQNINQTDQGAYEEKYFEEQFLLIKNDFFTCSLCEFVDLNQDKFNKHLKSKSHRRNLKRAKKQHKEQKLLENRENEDKELEEDEISEDQVRVKDCCITIENNLFICSICLFYTKKKPLLEQHFKAEVHLQKTKDSESQSDEYLTTENSNEKNSVNHQNVKIDSVQEVIENSEIERKNVKEENGKLENEIFKCSICSFSTFKKRKFERHLRKEKHIEKAVSTFDEIPDFEIERSDENELNDNNLGENVQQIIPTSSNTKSMKAVKLNEKNTNRSFDKSFCTNENIEQNTLTNTPKTSKSKDKSRKDVRKSIELEIDQLMDENGDRGKFLLLNIELHVISRCVLRAHLLYEKSKRPAFSVPKQISDVTSRLLLDILCKQ